VTASKLLGDARKAERKFDLAIEAYTRGLQGNINDQSFTDALIARADIYLQSGRYELAERDFTEALSIAGNNPEVRELRMLAAYQNNNYSIVLNDITVLSRLDDEFPQAPLDLLRGRVLMDRGQSTSPTEVLNVVTSSINQGLPDELVPIAYEYQAKAYFELEEFDNALNAINESLARQETGNRHCLRGLIQQSREETEDAILEYDWVLTWSQVYPYPFRVDARNRYNNVKELLADLAEAEAGNSS
jgi:tetratricopeptide (TPR) repeat protein